jgi:hypothetical protein
MERVRTPRKRSLSEADRRGVAVGSDERHSVAVENISDDDVLSRKLLVKGLTTGAGGAAGMEGLAVSRLGSLGSGAWLKIWFLC